MSLNNILGNLGLTIIVISISSRLIFHPLIISNLRYTKAARELKPRLDQIKKKYGKDMKRVASEQSKLFKAAGVSPAAGALGCLSLIIQLGVFFLLFNALLRVIDSGVDTSFLFWGLENPDTFNIPGIPLPVPGILVVLTAVASLIQAKMLATPSASNQPEKKKGDLMEALAFQGQLVYLFPLIILFAGSRFSSGLVLYWLSVTFFGIIQQYQAVGLGGLKPWVQKIVKTQK